MCQRPSEKCPQGLIVGCDDMTGCYEAMLVDARGGLTKPALSVEIRDAFVMHLRPKVARLPKTPPLLAGASGEMSMRARRLPCSSC